MRSQPNWHALVFALMIAPLLTALLAETSIQAKPDWQTMDRDRLTIIILCNRADFDPSALALRIADLYLENRK